jgi:hypothetical protein
MTMRRRNVINEQYSARSIEMLESPAYRALSLSGHRLISRIEIELANHGGNDNGRLPVTKEDFIAYGISGRMVAPAIREVEALGFIRVTQRGHGGNAEHRRPHHFLLTFAYGRESLANPPTHDWRKIKTIEEAEAIAAAARAAKDPTAVAFGHRGWRARNRKAQDHSLIPKMWSRKVDEKIETGITQCSVSGSLSVPETKIPRYHSVHLQGRVHSVVPLSISRGGGGGSGGVSKRQAPPSQGSQGNGHDAAPASEPLPIDVIARNRRGRPPIGLRTLTAAEPKRGNPSQGTPPDRPPSPAPSRAPDDDDIPALLRRCFRCNHPGDDALGPVTNDKSGWWMHFDCRGKLVTEASR